MNENTIKVWDPLVRIFHWSLVGAFGLAFVTAEEFESLHVRVGYFILGLVAFRLVWGVIGTRNARFTTFVKSPGAALAYVMDLVRLKARHYVGHNPAAGLMIVALLVALVVTSVTGLMTLGGEEAQGPLAPWMANFGGWGGEVAEEVHEVAAFGTLLLAGLHVVGVLASSLVHGENLIRAMVTGKKPAPPPPPSPFPSGAFGGRRTVGADPVPHTAHGTAAVSNGPRRATGER